MSIALTVFGVAIEKLESTICYVLLREVRGSGAYPKPNVPVSGVSGGVYSTPIADSSVTLVVWERVLTDEEKLQVESEMLNGRISLPKDCPVAGGHIITGIAIDSFVVVEGLQRASVTGVGQLYRKGIASDEAFGSLLNLLNVNIQPGSVPAVMRDIIRKVKELSGLKEIFEDRFSIGSVDYFYRKRFTEGEDGVLFEIEPVVPDFRSGQPVDRIRIRRALAKLGEKYTLQVILKNFDSVMKSVLIGVAEGEEDVVVSVSTHVTDVSLFVFDSLGELVDQVYNKFVQSVDFGISVLGSIDVLPPIFKHSTVTDLNARARISTMKFQGPSLLGKSGGMDTLRRQSASVEALLGKQSIELENCWFDRSVGSQVEVVRWIKCKIEQPGVSSVYLVDPFLGSDAFKRVVVRQGNQSASLYVVVSPGRVDPDGEVVNNIAYNSYLEKLKSTASDLAEKIAGDTTVLHVRRGDGSRQAFHDRYMCLVDDMGVPKVYLLSNSLSKAAGDWPFAICELSRVTSWRVYSYIVGLVGDDLGGVGSQSEIVWSNVGRKTTKVASKVSTSLLVDMSATVVEANVFLADIRKVVMSYSDSRDLLDTCIDLFLPGWGGEVCAEVFGDALFQVSGHRDAIAAFIANKFRRAGYVEIADVIDEKLLSQFLARLPGQDKRHITFIPADLRGLMFDNLSATICRRPRATNFVRSSLNARMDALINMIETQRHSFSWDAHESCIVLSIIALKVAVNPKAGPENYRGFLANDYIHWVGRVMRSDVTSIKYCDGNPKLDEWAYDFRCVVRSICQARAVLGDVLDDAIDRVNRDPWVPEVFKEALLSAHAARS